MTVYEDQMKCLSCSLHFIIYSDRTSERDPSSVYCPECGRHGSSMRLKKRVHQSAWVFQFVSA